MTTEALDQAIQIVGSMRLLGLKLGVTKGAVNHWKTTGAPVPAVHCPKIEKLTDRRVRCEQLNAEIDWAYIRGTCVTQTKKDITNESNSAACSCK